MTPQQRKELRRWSAIEPVIGHNKSNDKLDRDYLRGVYGEKINSYYVSRKQYLDQPMETEGDLIFLGLVSELLHLAS